MAGIQLTGLSSGLDTASIIESLMAIERLPRVKLNFKEVGAEARRTALSDVQGKLAALKLASTDLGSALTWLDTQTVSSSNDSKLTAQRVGGTGPGSYTFNVTQMASAERGTYTFMSPPTDVALTIGSGGTSANLTLPAGASLDDTVSMINSNPDTGVFAVNVNGEMVLSSRKTGAASTISVTANGSPIAANSIVVGKDAQYTIDGGAVQSSATNLIKNAIPGLDVTLKGITGPGGESVTVGGPGPDTSALKTKIKSFIAAYNDALTSTKAKYDDKPVLSPENNIDAGKGQLRGDQGLSQIMSAMRLAVSGEVAGGADPTMNLLSQIGISTGASTGSGTLNQDAIAGKLVFDEAKFDAAMAADPTKVRKLLGANGTGFSQAFSATIDNYSSAAGLLSERVTQADANIDSLKKSLDAFDQRLAMRQTYLERQFQSMEAALASSKAIGQQLSAQLSGLMTSR